ncbi:hypothetical protein PRIPAC_77798 [Pristionchus pacificus]|uniref:Uncharacterized protein n=1 Tax=Pristionchus pacificus TaxID=54126 RepID=A0A2A6BHN9_PRIPA|nr:hypothetical protein PRIPAC_77798 [Pristionchus pacificus]|eukprot:PDM65346.1 hypothetical protein PRIPAC_52288 [Pristionchus pacificus]
MSDNHANMANLQNLPIVVISEIIKQGQETAQGMKMISPRWNSNVVEYLNAQVDLLQRTHLIIQLEEKYRAYFGIDNWPFLPIVKDSTEKNMVEVNFSVATNRLLPKWAWSAVNEVAKGYSGCPESILVDLISSQSDDPSSSYMSKENLLARISHLLNRCSHIEKLMINFEMKYDEAEFEVIKGTMKTISVDHFELVGFTPSAESKILSLIKEHPVKSLTIEMFTPDQSFFAEAVLLTHVCIRVNTWFGQWFWKGLERMLNSDQNPVQVKMEYPKDRVVLIHVLPMEAINRNGNAKYKRLLFHDTSRNAYMSSVMNNGGDGMVEGYACSLTTNQIEYDCSHNHIKYSSCQ